MNSWMRFCKAYGIDYWLPARVYGYDETVEVVLAYIGFEVGIRKMNPTSIKTVYLGAIANHFVMNRIKNQFQSSYKDRIVKLMLEGLLKLHYRINPKAENRKLAFTLELVKYLRQAVRVAGKILSKEVLRALELALKFGIYFLLRKSEYLPCSNGRSRGISWKQIKFYRKGGYEVQWDELRNMKAAVSSITINIQFSKTDQYGHGRVVTHNRVDGTCCIVQDVVNWAIYCQSTLCFGIDDFMFSKKSSVPIIVDNLVAFAMKAIVRMLGWKDDKVSAHSLRYGGATMLAAAGLPQYLIEYFGGWAENSKSLKEAYIKLASQGVDRVSNIFSRGFCQSLEETRIRESSSTQS